MAGQAAGYRIRLALPRQAVFRSGLRARLIKIQSAAMVLPCPREFRYFKPVNDGDMLIDYRAAMSPITYGPNDGCTSTASA